MTGPEEERKRHADALYESYGKPLETEHRGKYVAISPEGNTIIAASAFEAAEEAAETLGPGSFLFKVGQKAAWRWRRLAV